MAGPLIQGGYILLSRKIIDSEIWRKPPLYLKIWIYLLSKAQHKQYKKLEQGQLRTSIPEIMEECSWYVGYRKEKPTKDQVYQVIDWLRKVSETVDEEDAKASMITTTKATQGLLINIVNYSTYQDPKNYKSNNDDNNEEDAKATREQQQPNNINNNDNNDNNDNKNIYTEIQNNKILKKDKKNKYSEFVSMTEEEYKKLLDKHGEELTNKMIETLDNYKGSSGKKYKSDYRAILNWVEGKILKETNYKPSTVNKKTRFHTENGRTSNYTSQELEEIARKRRANS